MNIIILIIANDEPKYYQDMQNTWKKYMNLHPNIKSFFIKGNQQLEPEHEEMKCILSNIKEENNMLREKLKE
jgi:hypothetical protein